MLRSALARWRGALGMFALRCAEVSDGIAKLEADLQPPRHAAALMRWQRAWSELHESAFVIADRLGRSARSEAAALTAAERDALEVALVVDVMSDFTDWYASGSRSPEESVQAAASVVRAYLYRRSLAVQAGELLPAPDSSTL